MCYKCSKVRCKIYGFVSGIKTTHAESCGETACNSHVNPRYPQQLNLGSDWKTLIPFVKKTANAFVKRVTKNKAA